jgi:hypothetical protein
VLYDAKRHTHTAQGLAISTIHGDLLWCDGGWPGSCHEHELLALAGLGELLDEVEVEVCWTADSVAWPRRAGTGMPGWGSPRHRPPEP